MARERRTDFLFSDTLKPGCILHEPVTGPVPGRENSSGNPDVPQFFLARVRTQIVGRAHSARLFPHPGNRFLYFPEANYSLCHHDIHPRARRQQRRSPMQKGRAWTGTGTLRTPATIPCNTRFPIRHTRRSRNQSCPGIMRLTPTRMKMTLALTRISRARSNRQNGSPGPGLRKKRRDGELKSGGVPEQSFFFFQ